MDLTANDLVSPQVNSYPTIFLYKAHESILYEGERDFESLKDLVEEHAGLAENQSVKDDL